MNYDELAREEAVQMLDAVNQELTKRERMVGLSEEDDPVITLLAWVRGYVAGKRPEFDDRIAEVLDRSEGLVQERYRASVRESRRREALMLGDTKSDY